MRIKTKLLKLRDTRYREWYLLSKRYRNDRYKERKIKIGGVEFVVPDAASFLAIWEELIIKEAYLFTTESKKPVIIDWGANVGVSVYFWVKKYPDAEIYAYEADPNIYKYLCENVSRFETGHIHLFNKAISNKDGQIYFHQEGADAGRVVGEGEEAITVKCISANTILNSFDKVEMLKIDIEGMECEVIPAIKGQLEKIENIFVEYHSLKNKKQKLIAVLNALKDFRIYIHPGYTPEKPLEEITDYMGFDMELNIFGKRLKDRL